METSSRFAVPGADPAYEHDKFRTDRLKMYEPIAADEDYQKALQYMAGVIRDVLDDMLGGEDDQAATETVDDEHEIDLRDWLERAITTTCESETMHRYIKIEADDELRRKGFLRSYDVGKECSSGDELHFARYLTIVETASGRFAASQGHYYHGYDEERQMSDGMPDDDEAGTTWLSLVSCSDDESGITWFDLDYFEEEVLYVQEQTIG